MKRVLKLYIAGCTPHAAKAIENISTILQDSLEEYQLQIFDVLVDPEQAEADRILATPTLVREHPFPARRIIGDLSDRYLVSQTLGLPTEGNK